MGKISTSVYMYATVEIFPNSSLVVSKIFFLNEVYNTEECFNVWVFMCVCIGQITMQLKIIVNFNIICNRYAQNKNEQKVLLASHAYAG